MKKYNITLESPVKPLLKWAGGKSMLIPFMEQELLNKDMLASCNRFIEPFAGSAAVSLFFQFPRMVLNDKNIKLMNFYEQVKNRPEKLFKKINKYSELHNLSKKKEDHYYNIREYYNNLVLVKNNGLTHAALFWVLNKTCFNGMYRETNSGKFNIPFGKRDCPIPCLENFISVSAVLKNCEIYSKQFDIICAMANKGDIVYLDPPYVPVSDTSNFSSYLRYGFGEEEHIKLCKIMKSMSENGIYVIMSNSDCDKTMDIYGTLKNNGFDFYKAETKRFISGGIKGRGKITEIFVSNRDLLHKPKGIEFLL